MRTIIPALLLSLFIIACQAEPEEIIPQIQNNCKIISALYDDAQDSANFTYVNNKIARVEGNDDYVLYQHSGSNITVRNFFEKPQNRLYQVDSIQYDASGKITKMITWYYDHPLYWDTSKVISNFAYASGRLSTITEMSTLFSPLGNYEDTVYNDFFFDAGGNISKLVFSDLNHEPYDSIMYQFNNHPNYFSVVHPHYFLFDPFLRIHVGMMAHIAYYYSRNNVHNFNIYGGWDYPVTYGLDSVNKVTRIEIGGIEYARYNYQCQ